MRTIYTRNNIEVSEKDCFISLYDRGGKLMAKAIVDAEYYDKVQGYKWHLSNSREYQIVRTNISRGRTLSLHNLVLGAVKLPSNLNIYHKDGDNLNNRKSNLLIGPPRGKKKESPNAVIFSKNHFYMLIKNGKSVAHAIVDMVDYDLVIKHKWHVNSDGYARTKLSKTKSLLMHRLIISQEVGDLSRSQIVDHVNRNRLDNRRGNLRLIGWSGNSHNRTIGKNNHSGLIGVSWNAADKVWVAQIQKNNKLHYLGGFKTKEKAHEAYKKAAKNLYGEFANSSLD